MKYLFSLATSDGKPASRTGAEQVLEFNAADFMQLMQVMSNSEDTVLGTRGPLPPKIIETDQKAADTIMRLCDEIGLSVSARSVEYIRAAKTSEELVFGLRHAKSTIHHELEGQRFYAPHASVGKYFRQGKLFGQDVWTKFPSANDDIYEAGMCLALDRYTACVMHLMRVHEVGLKALAAKLGVAHQNDWGGYLRLIEKTLKERASASGARSSDEQFFSEAAAQIDNVRRAYRNPTMHPDRSYNLERAEEIFASTQSLMRHLAQRLSDPDPFAA